MSRSSAAQLLAAARAVEGAPLRLAGSRALTLRELAAATGIARTRLRRTLQAMVQAGYPLESGPDPRVPGPVASRPKVYWLRRDEIRQGLLLSGAPPA